MARVIEFDTLARFAPTVKWRPDEQRGKVIPFMSQRRKVADEPACVAYEESDSEFSRWPERDEAHYQAALERAQPLRLKNSPFGELFRTPWRQGLRRAVHIGPFSDGGSIGS